jgi:hypothetical protein
MARRDPYTLEVQIWIPMEDKLSDIQKKIKADEVMSLADLIEKYAKENCPPGIRVRVWHNHASGLD